MLVLVAAPLLSAALIAPFSMIGNRKVRGIFHGRDMCGIKMLRNIDSCEALIFALDSAIDAASGELRPGVARLFDEATEAGTLVALLEPADRPLSAGAADLCAGATRWPLHGSDPTTAELTKLRQALVRA